MRRLLSASTTAASTTPYRHQFAYSMLGNITGMSTSSATTTYTYAETGYANPHAVTSVGGTTYAYDNNGNVTSIGSLDYTWDWRNRLASAERSGGGIASYGYDHTGQRMFKATGMATTSYPNKYYNLATTTGAATMTKHISAPDGTLLATVDGGGVNATTTYLHPDHLGGTNVTTDEDGEVTQTLDYYPYGSQRIATGPFAEQRRFIGEEYDPDTAFSYLNARYYSGDRGQFLSQDSVFQDLSGLDAQLLDPQLMNSYSYARNNPLNLIDSQGEFVDIPWISNSLYFQDAANAAYEHSAGWRFALDNSIKTSLIVSVAAYPALASGGGVVTSVNLATYPGVGTAFIAKNAFAGLIYSILAGSSAAAIPGYVDKFGRSDPSRPSSIILPAGSLALGVGLSAVGGYPGALYNSYQLGSLMSRGVVSAVNNFASSNIETRAQAVNSFNSSSGATTNESKLWTTPNGTIISWHGDIISPAPDSN